MIQSTANSCKFAHTNDKIVFLCSHISISVSFFFSIIRKAHNIWILQNHPPSLVYVACPLQLSAMKVFFNFSEIIIVSAFLLFVWLKSLQHTDSVLFGQVSKSVLFAIILQAFSNVYEQGIDNDGERNNARNFLQRQVVLPANRRKAKSVETGFSRPLTKDLEDRSNRNNNKQNQNEMRAAPVGKVCIRSATMIAWCMR